MRKVFLIVDVRQLNLLSVSFVTRKGKENHEHLMSWDYWTMVDVALLPLMCHSALMAHDATSIYGMPTAVRLRFGGLMLSECTVYVFFNAIFGAVLSIVHYVERRGTCTWSQVGKRSP